MTRPPSPASLIELATAYQRSKVLFAMIQLEIPTLLADGPLAAHEIAVRLGADPLAANRLLSAGAALGILNRDRDGFRNALTAQRYLVRGTSTYLGDEFSRYERMSNSSVWTRFAQRVCSWRSEAPDGELSPEGVPIGAELEGQHRLSLLAGEALGAAHDFSANRRLLDLGGGTGSMSMALCRRNPALNAVVLERPAIIPVAQAYVRDSGLDDRIEVREGDIVHGPLPDGCDVVLLANVLSMLSVETNRALLGRLFEYLPGGGSLVLSGWMLHDTETSPLASVLFCLEDILLGAPDVERTASDYAGWLAQAGFLDIEHVMYLEPLSLVAGRKPRDPA